MTVYIEFFGLPGCGKSTISHKVASVLRRQGNKVIEPTYYIDHNYPRVIRKIIKLSQLLFLLIKLPKKSLQLKQLVKENGYTGSDILKQMSNIAYKINVYNLARADYILFDEGVLQSSVSLGNTPGRVICNEQKLLALCKNVLIVKIYIKTSVEIVLERLAARCEHDSRVEKIGNVKRQKEELNRISECLDAMNKDAIVIDNDRINPGKAVKTILNYLNDR